MSASIQAPSDSGSPSLVHDQPAPTKPAQRTLSPLFVVLGVPAVLVAACIIPSYLLLRSRLVRVDRSLSDVVLLTRRAEASTYTQSQMLEALREMRRVRDQIDVLRGQVDKVASDVRDVRSVLLKERVRLGAIEGRFDGLSEQMKSQEQRVLSALAAEQKRYSKTENEINELLKTADQNADNLSKVAVSLADIATFIEQTELEQGVPPEQGKESSKRVSALREKAFDVWQSNESIYNKEKY